VPDEEIPTLADEVGMIAEEMVLVGDDEQVEILVRLDEDVDQPDGVVGIDVLVQLSMGQEQLSLQLVRDREAGLLDIMLPHRVVHPHLVPRGLVHAVVVVA